MEDEDAWLYGGDCKFVMEIITPTETKLFSAQTDITSSKANEHGAINSNEEER